MIVLSNNTAGDGSVGLCSKRSLGTRFIMDYEFMLKSVSRKIEVGRFHFQI